MENGDSHCRYRRPPGLFRRCRTRRREVSAWPSRRREPQRCSGARPKCFRTALAADGRVCACCGSRVQFRSMAAFRSSKTESHRAIGVSGGSGEQGWPGCQGGRRRRQVMNKVAFGVIVVLAGAVAFWAHKGNPQSLPRLRRLLRVHRCGPSRSATRRLEDGYAIDQRFDCISKESHEAVTSSRQRWEEAHAGTKAIAAAPTHTRRGEEGVQDRFSDPSTGKPPCPAPPPNPVRAHGLRQRKGQDAGVS